MAHAAKTFDHIGELFSGFGPVAVKRMFGGAGIYAGGTMFAIVIDGAIYLKADEHSIPAFEAEGLTPFTYEAKNKRAVMSYWRYPTVSTTIRTSLRNGRGRRWRQRSGPQPAKAGGKPPK